MEILPVVVNFPSYCLFCFVLQEVDGTEIHSPHVSTGDYISVLAFTWQRITGLIHIVVPLSHDAQTPGAVSCSEYQ